MISCMTSIQSSSGPYCLHPEGRNYTLIHKEISCCLNKLKLESETVALREEVSGPNEGQQLRRGGSCSRPSQAFPHGLKAPGHPRPPPVAIVTCPAY